jgi:sugar phosphate permease
MSQSYGGDAPKPVSFKISPANKVLIFLCVLYLLLYMDRVNLSVAAAAIKAEFHLSSTQLGLAFAAFGYGYASFQIIGGWIGDKIGPRRTLGFFLVMWGCVAIAIGFVDSLATLIIARIALGIAEGTALPTATRALAAWLPAERRGIGQGIVQGCSRFGTAIAAPIIAGIIILFGTWRGSFWILGSAGLLWAVSWVWFYRDPRGIDTKAKHVTPGTNRAIKAEGAPWGPLFKRMAPAMGVWFCQGWTFWMFLSWIPLFLLTQYKVDLKTSAIFTAGIFFSGIAGDVVGGVATDKILRKTGNIVKARRDIVMLAFAGTAAFVAPVIFVRHNVDIVAFCLCGALFFLELMTGPMWSVPMDIAPAHAGTAAGLMNTGSAVASIITPLIFGFIVDRTGNWNIPFIGSFMFLIIGCALATQIRPDLQLKSAQEDLSTTEVATATR